MKTITSILFSIGLLISASCSDDNMQTNNDSSEGTEVMARTAEEDIWDWTNPSNYKYAYIQGKGRIPISSPFSTFSSANKDLSYIIQGQDYLSTQGWVLLTKVFGNEDQYMETNYPYFILYNKYRGIIRLYAFNNDEESYSSAIASMNWVGTNFNSLLGNGTFDKDNVSNNKIVNYITDFSSHSWFSTDFVVTFDPQTTIEDSYTIEIKIKPEISSTIDLKGVFMFETKSASLPYNSNTNSPIKMAGKVLKNLPDGKSIGNIIKTINSITGNKSGIDEKEMNTKLKTEQQKTISQIDNKNFANILGNISSVAHDIGGVIGSVASICDLFIGKSSAVSKVEIMPTVSEGSTEISGTITTITNGARYVLQLPGTNHKYNDGTYIKDGLPVYDKPLGVFCLEEEPVIDCKMATDYYEVKYSDMTTDYYEVRYGDKEHNHDYTYRSYRASGMIKLAINKNSGLEYVAGTAQLFTTGIPSKKHEVLYDPICDGLYETLLRNDSISCYGTHTIPLEKFRNTVINTSLNSKVFLRITLVLNVTDSGEKTPVIISKVYAINAIDRNTRESAYTNSYYDFSPFQAKDCSLPSTSDSNALILTYY